MSWSGTQNYTWGVAISPDGRLVASSSPDRTVKLWDAKSAELVHTFTEEPTASLPDALAFAPDGQTLAAGTEDGSVKLWHVPSRTLARTLVGHTGRSTVLVFSRDGHILATGGADRIVRLWNPADGDLANRLRGAHAAPLAPSISRPTAPRSRRPAAGTALSESGMLRPGRNVNSCEGTRGRSMSCGSRRTAHSFPAAPTAR